MQQLPNQVEVGHHAIAEVPYHIFARQSMSVLPLAPEVVDVVLSEVSGWISALIGLTQSFFDEWLDKVAHHDPRVLDALGFLVDLTLEK